jgi:uncharacterized protein YpmB
MITVSDNVKWVIGIVVAILAIVVPILFMGKKKMMQSQSQSIEGKGAQKQSQNMEE